MFTNNETPDICKAPTDPSVDAVVEDLALDENDAEAVKGGLGKNPKGNSVAPWNF
jgi:hypothetical protein